MGEGETSYVSQIIMHPHYNGNNFDYDFCILKLFGKLRFDVTRRAIALPDEDDFTPVGEFARVLGWGNTLHPLESTDKLRGVDLIIIDDIECEKMYQVYNVDIVKNKICATHPDRIDGKDACQGELIKIESIKRIFITFIHQVTAVAHFKDLPTANSSASFHLV